MYRPLIQPGMWLAALLALGLSLPGNAALKPAQDAAPAPAFTHRDADAWLNSAPLDLDALRGHVVLIDFWTFACWNCFRSFPWLTAMEARLHDRGLRVIGVHTPEFDYERIRANVEKKIAEYGLEHPVMIDNDFSYWRAIGNRYWPAYYLLDKQGRIRASYVGETHAGDRQARRIESDIEALLAE